MGTIKWNPGTPPRPLEGKRLLLIAHPTGITHDAVEDNRPDIYLGHYRDGHGENVYVPARVWGMQAKEARPALDVKYWAEIDLPPDVELRLLTRSDIEG
jgi:hypothetical protein